MVKSKTACRVLEVLLEGHINLSSKQHFIGLFTGHFTEVPTHVSALLSPTMATMSENVVSCSLFSMIVKTHFRSFRSLWDVVALSRVTYF